MNVYRLYSDEFFENEYLTEKIEKRLLKYFRFLQANYIIHTFLKVIIGLLFFAFPILNFFLTLQKTFDYSNINMNFKMKCSAFWMIFTINLIIVYVFLIFIYKVWDIITFPNIKYWNISILGFILQYLVLFITIDVFFIILSNNLQLLEGEIQKLFSFDFILDNIMTFFDDKKLSQIYLIIFDRVKSNLNIISFFLYFYLIRLILFRTRNTFSLAGMNISLILLLKYVPQNFQFNKINEIFTLSCFYFSLFLIFYFFYTLESIIQSTQKKSKVEQVFELFTILGICYLLRMNSIYLSSDDINLDNVYSMYEYLKKGIILIILGNILKFGNLILDFLFYPIRKEYVTYENKILQKHILLVNNY